MSISRPPSGADLLHPLVLQLLASSLLQGHEAQLSSSSECLLACLPIDSTCCASGVYLSYVSVLRFHLYRSTALRCSVCCCFVACWRRGLLRITRRPDSTLRPHLLWIVKCVALDRLSLSWVCVVCACVVVVVAVVVAYLTDDEGRPLWNQGRNHSRKNGRIPVGINSLERWHYRHCTPMIMKHALSNRYCYHANLRFYMKNKSRHRQDMTIHSPLLLRRISPDRCNPSKGVTVFYQLSLTD
jgi:hypothetical protein